MKRWTSGRRGHLHQRLQTIFAVLAIGTAVALPVILLSVGGGVSQHELNSLENAGYEIAVSGSGIHGVSSAHSLSDRIANLTEVKAASPILSQPIVAFLSGSGPIPVLAEGVVPLAFEASEGPTERSLFPSPLPLGDPTDSIRFANGAYDGPSASKVLISSPLAGALGVTTGTVVLLSGSDNRSAGASFTVTGTFGVPPSALGPTAAFAVLLPLSDLQILTGTAKLPGVNGATIDRADTIQVALVGSAATNPGTVLAVSSEIQNLVPYYGVTNLADQATQLGRLANVLTGFYLALSSVSLTIGITFLALVQLRRVEADRRTIGVRRAIGLPNRMIASGIVLDGLRLAGIGAAIGVATGIVLIGVLAAFGSGSVQEAAQLAIFNPVTLALVVLGVLGFSLLSSGLASRAAFRISIPETLR